MAAVFFGLVVLEILARAGSWGYWQWRYRTTARDLDNRHLRFDSGLGWVSPDEQRFRGREDVSPERAADVFRIVALGDSCVYGVGVRSQEAWPARLQTMLSDAPLTVEVLNAGVPGYELGQLAWYLQRDLLAYHPDLVIVYTNPFGRTDRGTRVDLSSPKRLRPPGPVAAAVQRMLFRFKSYYLMKKLIVALRDPEQENVFPFETQATGNLARIATACAAIGSDLLFVEYVLWPEGEFRLRVSGDATRAWEAPYVRILPAMERSGMTPEQLMLDQVHPTAAGHQIIAREIAQKNRRASSD
ncbi:MAG: GDSL-type esterase/lipase family protein [Deltaproteobacteria bacterium]|nr:GDSL-type esterase/lipase family protein [Deltaproteobacteria bacterium]